ncbi:MAG: site-specific integrase [Sarcina sp.]|nr:site-specific integrase [Sarcina sp.]
MSEKRKDKRGRLLRDGETQNADGRYRYSYIDNDGKRKQVYSWKLVMTDRLPSGKRDCVSLREQEAEIRKQIEQHKTFSANGMTVYELAKWYCENRAGVKHTTRAGYKTVCKLLESDSFGNKRIDAIKSKDAKDWLVKLQKKDGKSYSSVHTIRGVLRGAFKEASFREWIYKNPFDDFKLSDAVDKDTQKRDAMTQEVEDRFMAFIKEDKHYCRYYDGIYILLHTGMRISEFCGLTLDDINMDNRTINIDHQIMRVGVNVYIEDSTKTKSGKRILPMEDDVYECFSKLITNRKTPKIEPVVDGYSGFLCLDKDDNPTLALHWEHYFRFIRQKYNSHYNNPLPKITPHVMRHTYCTRKALGGMNPKVLQYLMGHSSIEITLGYYTHARYEDAKAELERLKKANDKA